MLRRRLLLCQVDDGVGRLKKFGALKEMVPPVSKYLTRRQVPLSTAARGTRQNSTVRALFEGAQQEQLQRG